MMTLIIVINIKDCRFDRAVYSFIYRPTTSLKKIKTDRNSAVATVGMAFRDPCDLEPLTEFLFS